MEGAQLSTHDAAMIAKIDAQSAAVIQQSTPTPVGQPPAGSPAPAPEAKQRPEGVPEKFWDAAKGEVMTDALIKSYTELESTRSKPADTPAAPPEGTPEAAAAAAAKLDVSVLEQEFTSTGALSEASYKALEGAGFGKDIVDGYIAGQVALASARDAEGFALAGGAEQYKAMASWAQTNMTAADLAAFDAAVVGSPAQMKQAITALKAQYTAANGSAPSLHNGVPSGNAGEAPFASRAEVTAAMRDSRYKADPAYRSMVERRIGLMENF